MSMNTDLEQALATKYGKLIRPHDLCHVCRAIIKGSSLLQTWAARRAAPYPITPAVEKPRDYRGRNWDFAFVEQCTYHASFSELEASMEDGCHLCTLIHSRMMRWPPELRPESAQTRIEDGYSSRPLGLYFRHDAQEEHVSFNYDPWSYCKIMGLETGTIGDHERPEWTVPNRDPAADHNASVHTIGMIKGWFSECSAKHSDCHRHFPIRKPPTRLLRIATDPPTLSLKTSPGLPESLEYIALSYRWGDVAWDESSLLTTKKINQWTTSIQFKLLPATVRDAIYLTHHLGFEYLWIDRLCIIQDSSEDFALEAKSMGQYFDSASITLAALAATSVEEGMFSHRNPLALRPCYIEELNLSVQIHDQSNFEVPTDRTFNFNSQTSARWFSTELQTRAWVLQEEILSPRLVYYDKAYVFWECCTMSRSDPHVVDFKFKHAHVDEKVGIVPNEIVHQKGRLMQDLLKHKTKLPRNEGDMEDHETFEAYNPPYLVIWQKIVDEFLRRSLSQSRDRWRAIEGVANLLQILSGKKMSYGLWNDDDLSHRLLWNSEINFHKRGPEHHRLPDVAPSWSWASVSGKVRQHHIMRPFNPPPGLFRCSIATFINLKKPYPDIQFPGCAVITDYPLGKAKITHGCQLQRQAKSNRTCNEELILKPTHRRIQHAKTEFYPDIETCEDGDAFMLPLYRSRAKQDRTFSGLVLRRHERHQHLWTRIGTFSNGQGLWPDNIVTVDYLEPDIEVALLFRGPPTASDVLNALEGRYVYIIV